MALAKINDIEFSVVDSESVSHSTEITEKSVEHGQDVSDHAKPLPRTMTISGVVVGTDSPLKLEKLRLLERNRELVTYIGRNIFHDLIIQRLDTEHNVDVRNGFRFDITLKHVRIVSGVQVNISVAKKTVNPTTKKKDAKTNTQAKTKTTRGKQQPRKK